MYKITNNWNELTTNCEILRSVKSSQRHTKMTMMITHPHKVHCPPLRCTQTHSNPHRETNLHAETTQKDTSYGWLMLHADKTALLRGKNVTAYVVFWTWSRHGSLMCWVINNLNLRDLRWSTSFRKTMLVWIFMLVFSAGYSGRDPYVLNSFFWRIKMVISCVTQYMCTRGTGI